MKPLLKFTEERIEQMSGHQLHALNQNHCTYGAFYAKLADVIVESSAFCEWLQEAVEDPDDEELSNQLQFTLRRHILKYIKLHYKDLIDDRIYDYLDFQDLRKDPDKYFAAPA